MNVKMIRMWSGEDVIADLIEEKDDYILITNPIVGVPTGNGQAGFAPWSPFLKGKDVELKITKKYVVYIADTQDQIIDQYSSMFSVIQAPSKKLVL